MADHRLRHVWARTAHLLIVVALVFGAGWLERASASSLGVNPRTMSGGAAAIIACDPNGFTFRYALDTVGHITDVTVGGIGAACAGGTLRLTLTNGTTSIGQGSAALPSSGFSGTANVTVSPVPQSDQVSAVYAAIEGP